MISERMSANMLLKKGSLALVKQTRESEFAGAASGM